MVQKTRIGSLDFDSIKASIKNYLSQQPEFTDYNMEGANMTQLINVLAYNAHYDALAANFLANEVFMDTATKRTSVVSRAKELGYTPRSRRSSNCVLSVKLKNVANEGSIGSMILPQGTRFTSTVNEEQFTYTTMSSAVLTKQIELGSPVFVGNVTVYEGVLVQQVVTYSSVENNINIPNLDIDTTTLKVEVYESGAWVEYIQPQNFLAVNSTSNAYMIQEGFKGFEITFGDGVLGKQPANLSNVRMTYVVASGDAANGALNFTMTSAVSGMLSNTIVTVTALAASAGGAIEETIDSVRLNAKNTYGSQNRAVIAQDYAALAQINFPNVKDVLSWSGSDNVPPRFGKTILCVQPTSGDVLPQNDKAIIADFLNTKAVGNVKVEFVDPEYLNVEIYSRVKYDINALKVGVYELEFIVKAAITEYARTAIQKFKGSLRYSPLVSAIDAADYSITGNETTLKISKQLRPNLFSANSFNFSFANQVRSGSIASTGFFDGLSSNRLYMKDLDGKLHVYYSMNGSDTLYLANVGTVNYVTGDVVISNLSIATIDGFKMKLTATPENMDIYSNKNIILTLIQENIALEIIRDDKM